MPELPEVEVSRRGIEPELKDRRILRAEIRVPALRWPIPADLATRLEGATVTAVERRAKYLLLICKNPGHMPVQGGVVLLHLGMSGSLRFVPTGTPPEKHDHVDLVLGEKTLRLRDPRRFGALLYTEAPQTHPLLASLGPEPFDEKLDGGWLYQQLQRRSGPVKPALMDARLIVGIGNIYAAESLFRAGISPTRAANKISRPRCASLLTEIRETLAESIAAGGSSVRDYVHSDGGAGCFQINCHVYDRAGQPCRQCGQPIRQIRQAGRSTFYCAHCQR